MMTLISAVTTSVKINVITNVIATATPVESSSSDSSLTIVKDRIFKSKPCSYVCMYISHGVHIIFFKGMCIQEGSKD